MIVKGAVRGDGAQLAAYLLHDKNDRVEELIELQTAYNGLGLDIAIPAFEAEAVGTRCEKPLYHAQMSPAHGERLTREQVAECVALYEKHMGFEGLPRVVVMHEKDGHQHYHIVWGRIGLDGKARDYKHNYATHEKIAREIERRFNLTRVQGWHVDQDGEPLRKKGDRRRSVSQAEREQEARSAKPIKERKAEITHLWNQTTTGREFRAALQSAGYTLAYGNRRTWVVVDSAGEVHSLARQIDGAKVADLRARMVDLNPTSIPMVDEIKQAMNSGRAEKPRARGQPDDAARPDQAHQRAVGEHGDTFQTRAEPPKPVSDFDQPDPRPLTDPDKALAELTRQHSTFTQADLSRYAREHCKTPEQTVMLIDAVQHHPQLVLLGEDRTGRARFTSRTMLRTELQMEDHAATLAKSRRHGVRQGVREAVPGIDKLSTEQKASYEHILGHEGLALVEGWAGSGKSFTLGAARKAWVAEGYRVQGLALSGIAAESLQEGSAIESRTLHSFLARLQSGRQQLSSRDVLVLDEAGMVGSRQMEALLRFARDAGAKVILVGDAEQLQAIDAGGAFRAIRERHGAATITEVRRQTEQWQRSATGDFAQGRTAEGLERYRRHGMVHQTASREAAKDALIDGWKKARAEKPDQTHIILAYTRADVGDLNYIAREAYRAEGRLGEDAHLQTATGGHTFAQGDRLYFTQNNTKMGVRNGTLGTIEKIADNHLTVRTDAGKFVTFSLADYNHIAHGYAATVHKSQGVTVDRAHVLASRYMDRHAAYVGCTRHRDRVDVFYSREEFRSFDRMATLLSRDRLKDTGLDYLKRGEPARSWTESLRAAAAVIWREIKQAIRVEPEIVRGDARDDRTRPPPVDPAFKRENVRGDSPTRSHTPPKVDPAFARETIRAAERRRSAATKRAPDAAAGSR